MYSVLQNQIVSSNAHFLGIQPGEKYIVLPTISSIVLASLAGP